ncbi:MAG TPA: hypothetical protein PK528_13615 [Syntrophorhabdus sp.]|nr:hypothetical protein [Syntrophorhabdus sp.]
MIGKKLVKQKAADIYLDANKPYEQSLGDLLFKYFIEDRELLGIDFVVWDQQKSQGGKVRSYPLPPNTCEIAKTGEKAKPWEKKSCLHRDHIHVEFKSREADEDHSSALMNTVAKVKKALAQQTP